MQLIRGRHNIKQKHTPCVLAIGNFDGLHLGHQALLTLLKSMAEKTNTPSCLMTFEPLPHEFFCDNASASPRLMNTRDKWQTLNNDMPELRPDYMLIENFNTQLAELQAEDFIQNILIDTLAIKGLVVGDDFKFGRARQGNFKMLTRFGEKHGFLVQTLSTHQIDDLRISSTGIREALQQGNLAQAQKMLGRPYYIYGCIKHGDKRGRTIGFPTANIHLQRLVTPLSGVYSVTMHIPDEGDVGGIANVGRRPTVDGERIQLEVHLFDYDRDLYGKNVRVTFHHKIRDELKFESFDALKNQIQLDCMQARSLLEQS